MNIKCPKCENSFLLTDAIDKEKMDAFKKEITKVQQAEIETEKVLLREKMNAYSLKKDEEKEMAIKQIKEKYDQEEKRMALKIKEDNEAKMQYLLEQNNIKDAKLKDAQAKEIEILHLQKKLMDNEQSAAYDKEKALLEHDKIVRAKYEQEFLPKALEASAMAMKEKDTQLESMKKTIEQLKQKSEQGSMQAQGEAQELLLEELLRASFPIDTIGEVSKGVRGADCMQTVRNRNGIECGTIIYESKRTKDWNNEWIEKLKIDMRNAQADISVIVTKVLPKEIKVFGQKDGVWICTYTHATALATVLRDGLLKISEVQKGQENKGEKMVMLYDFLISNEFSQQMQAIVEGFTNMRDAITKERIQMEKIWKEREKQLDKVLLNTSGMYGSIKGIAGGQMGYIKLLDGSSEDE